VGLFGVVNRQRRRSVAGPILRVGHLDVNTYLLPPTEVHRVSCPPDAVVTTIRDAGTWWPLDQPAPKQVPSRSGRSFAVLPECRLFSEFDRRSTPLW